MMLVQMQFRCAHLIGVLDVDRQQSGPRHHRNHVPGGTSKACGQADNGWMRNLSGGMRQCRVGPEVGVINPHTVQYHAYASRQGNHGTLCATAAGDLCAPRSQPG